MREMYKQLVNTVVWFYLFHRQNMYVFWASSGNCIIKISPFFQWQTITQKQKARSCKWTNFVRTSVFGSTTNKGAGQSQTAQCLSHYDRCRSLGLKLPKTMLATVQKPNLGLSLLLLPHRKSRCSPKIQPKTGRRMHKIGIPLQQTQLSAIHQLSYCEFTPRMPRSRYASKVTHPDNLRRFLGHGFCTQTS